MTTLRKTATAVGVLYIIGTVSGVLSVLLAGPVVNEADYLVEASANANTLRVGGLLVLTMGFALAMIPVLLYPVLSSHNRTLALGYVVFRGALEAATYMVTFVGWLLLIPLSREFVAAGMPSESHFQASGASLRALQDLPLTALTFSLGALMLYSILYRSALIPRWISIWGIAAIVVHLASSMLVFVGTQASSDTTSLIMNLPIALQEMVMAAWLIAKGFNPDAASGTRPSTT